MPILPTPCITTPSHTSLPGATPLARFPFSCAPQWPHSQHYTTLIWTSLHCCTSHHLSSLYDPPFQTRHMQFFSLLPSSSSPSALVSTVFTNFTHKWCCVSRSGLPTHWSVSQPDNLLFTTPYRHSQSFKTSQHLFCHHISLITWPPCLTPDLSSSAYPNPVFFWYERHLIRWVGCTKFNDDWSNTFTYSRFILQLFLIYFCRSLSKPDSPYPSHNFSLPFFPRHSQIHIYYPGTVTLDPSWNIPTPVPYNRLLLPILLPSDISLRYTHSIPWLTLQWIYNLVTHSEPERCQDNLLPQLQPLSSLSP
jgi:hypothetical protein